MSVLNFKYKNATANGVEEVGVALSGTTYEILKAYFVQSAATVATHGSNFRVLTLKNAAGSTIGTITTDSGAAGAVALTQGAATAFTFSGPENAIIAADAVLSVAGTIGGSGQVADGQVSLQVKGARSY